MSSSFKWVEKKPLCRDRGGWFDDQYYSRVKDKASGRSYRVGDYVHVRYDLLDADDDDEGGYDSDSGDDDETGAGLLDGGPVDDDDDGDGGGGGGGVGGGGGGGAGGAGGAGRGGGLGRLDINSKCLVRCDGNRWFLRATVTGIGHDAERGVDTYDVKLDKGGRRKRAIPAMDVTHIAYSVAQLVALWQDQHGAKWAEVRWYKRTDEIPDWDGKLKEYMQRRARGPCGQDEVEVFGQFEATDVDEIELETLEGTVEMLGERDFRARLDTDRSLNSQRGWGGAGGGGGGGGDGGQTWWWGGWGAWAITNGGGCGTFSCVKIKILS
jgi:hypothetical protein